MDRQTEPTNGSHGSVSATYTERVARRRSMPARPKADSEVCQ